jgi:hypothetical protein
MNPYKDKDLRAFLDSIPQDEIDRQTLLQAEQNKRVHDEFIEGLKIGKCFLCDGQMDSFEVDKPCFHWFTNPQGIKKKYFESYLQKPIGFFQLDSYFRWLANTEKPIGNINDLKDETSATSYIEATYKYKDIEWAFSIGHTDKEGHLNSQVGSTPHYHIQMKVGGRVFLNFNNFHIPFSDSDLFTIEMLEQVGDKAKLGHSYGYGIGILEDEEILEQIDEVLTVTDDYENAPFNRQTMIVAKEGQTISGDMIKMAFDESKITKQPIGKIMQRLLNEANMNANIVSVLYPGDGVPKIKKRSVKK